MKKKMTMYGDLLKDKSVKYMKQHSERAYSTKRKINDNNVVLSS